MKKSVISLKKIIIGAMCLTILVIAGTTFALAENNDDKVKGLYESIDSLQTQIDNIQLIPGP